MAASAAFRGHAAMQRVTPPHERGLVPRGATMSRDLVQQDMFTVLHGQPAPVVTRWSYSAYDPFAVSLAVRTRHDRWVEWLVGRELVIAGLDGLAGGGGGGGRPGSVG